ncbi:MltA domain-containing protein, partial [Pseudomonas aeruginosa]|uniref:MltA domain-containing protein n=1 Tax=Pseudomonas aeruginosa TaxID=287 RepID=UPI002020EADD
AAIAEVPFVDVLNSMLNPDLPLTVTEYDEWGNPQEPEVHARIAAYAPYENVRAQDYPHLPVLAWLGDPMDLQFLQIQGSGRIQLEDGRQLRIGY